MSSLFDYYRGKLSKLQREETVNRVPFSLPYRQHPHQPYWGQINSHANFCEEDYIVTTYIAEFINTISNLVYVYYAYYGITSNSSRSDAILRNFSYLGIASVGIGSAIYHASLKNYTQWGDDLSMLFATSAVLHRVFTFDKSLTYTVVFGIILSAAMTSFSTYHCITDELVMHSVIWGIMIVAVGWKTRIIINSRVPDRVVRKDVKRLTSRGAGIFVFGWILWNLDNALCTQLTTIKRTIGMPWSFIFEFHGWWHLFTGVGAYIFIALVEYLTSDEAGQPLASRFAWPVGSLVTGKSLSAVSDGSRSKDKKI